MRNCAVVLISIAFCHAAIGAQPVRVPFVGCAQDGQAGPIEAPKAAVKTLQVPVGVAKRFAFYGTNDSFGVLAPRGWYCFGVYDSSGGTLFVSHRPLTYDDLFVLNWRGMEAPVIELNATQGAGSGIALVAEVWARVFPGYWPIVKGFIDNHDLPADEYTFGPYPHDKLLVQTPSLVRFQTPPNSEGLGTMGHFKANNDPIDGVAILVDQNPNLLMLRVRLRHELRDLAPVIIREFENEHK